MGQSAGVPHDSNNVYVNAVPHVIVTLDVIVSISI